MNLGIEFFCCYNGQSLLRTISNICTAFLLILIIQPNDRKYFAILFYFLFDLWTCIEAYNFAFVAEPFNALSISALDKDIIKLHPIFKVQAWCAVFLLFTIVFIIPILIKYFWKSS